MLLATSQAPLTEWSALQLAGAIRDGDTDAREVVDAHIEVLQRSDLNAVVSDRFDTARAEADAADRRIAEGEEDLPALLGVPCTIKESFAVAGMPNTSG